MNDRFWHQSSPFLSYDEHFLLSSTCTDVARRTPSRMQKWRQGHTMGTPLLTTSTFSARVVRKKKGNERIGNGLLCPFPFPRQPDLIHVTLRVKGGA